MSKKYRYIKNLNKNPKTRAFCEASSKMLKAEPAEFSNKSDYDVIYQTTAMVTGPVLVSYILWVLKSAMDSGLDSLYFLARDGKIMKDIAEIIINRYHLNIKCYYLCASRYSLRNALYNITPNEVIEYMFKDALVITPEVIMKRSGLKTKEQNYFLEKLGYLDIYSCQEQLSSMERYRIRNNLSRDSEFQQAMKASASEKYERIIQYFREIGLTRSSKIGLVDSGWTGSMQRCIRQILEADGKHPCLEGYYFGIQRFTDAIDGEYHGFYFMPLLIWRYVHFNNNLFESWCMADHGMTIDYQKNSHGKMEPVFKKQATQWHEKFQQDQIHKYTMEFISVQQDMLTIPVESLADFVEPLITSFMMHPSTAEAVVYGKIPFCDDSSESYLQTLAKKMPIMQLSSNLVIFKFTQKFFHRPAIIYETAWKEGSIALQPFGVKLLMNVDCKLVRILKYLFYSVKTKINS